MKSFLFVLLSSLFVVFMIKSNIESFNEFKNHPNWQHETSWEIESKKDVKEVVKYFSNDPGGTVFRNIVKVGNDTWCGEVNTPNPVGNGRLGFMKFAVHKGNVSIGDWIDHRPKAFDVYCSEWERENPLKK